MVQSPLTLKQLKIILSSLPDDWKVEVDIDSNNMLRVDLLETDTPFEFDFELKCWLVEVVLVLKNCYGEGLHEEIGLGLVKADPEDFAQHSRRFIECRLEDAAQVASKIELVKTYEWQKELQEIISNPRPSRPQSRWTN